MDHTMKQPLTEAEERRYKAGIPKETITEERIWNKRPDGSTIKMPTSETVGEFVILELKRISPRMVGESEKLYNRSKISKRAGPTRKPSLFQGPVSRHSTHRVH
jgi:hypothetical protein